MKKLLLGIFAFFIGCISFSSADYYFSGYNYKYSYDGGLELNNGSINNCDLSNITYIFYYYNDDLIFNSDPNFDPLSSGIGFGSFYNSFIYSKIEIPCLSSYFDSYGDYNFVCGQDLDGGYTFDSCSLLSSSPSTPEITVFYDYGHSSTTISCNGDNSIYINGMASLSGISTFTPFFNISYVDEDNQSLIESYNKDILYLQDGKFKKTYTGDNEWVLSVQEQSNGLVPDVIFTGLDNLPVDITGSSDNVFSNFGNNALELIYGNIPGIITWGFILFIILFIIRLFIPKNRR